MAEKKSSAATPEPVTHQFETWMKLTGTVLAALTFAFGIYTYQTTSDRQIAQAKDEAFRIAESRRIEASKPFLEKQLKLFTEATAVAAVIATSNDDGEIAKARVRFLQLYWGELGMVERGGVSAAMINFKNALDANRPQEVLQPLALVLAHACRDELGKAWDTDAWQRQ